MTAPVSHGGGVVSTAPVSAGAVRELATLQDRPLNFEPVGFERAAVEPGWHVDHASVALTAESPGEPEPDGPFQTARDALIAYRFADPNLVRAVYDTSDPLEGRDLLLVGHFFGLRFHMGVRVSGVTDARIDVDERPAYRFSFGYRTLEGHLERGHMDYELTKWLDSGEIEFAIHAYSRPGDIDSPIVRLGFALFARPLQVRFYRRVLSNMQDLVATRHG